MSDMGGSIDLDFGGVESITGFVPVPSGAYVLEFTEASVEPTKDTTGKNVVVQARVAEGPLAGRSVGKDFWYVPNRLVQEQKKYETTAGYFKGRLEAIYDRPFEGQIKFNVKDLPGMKFKAIVMLEDTGYGPQNKITAYLPMNTDLSNVRIPAPSAPRQRSDSNSGGSTGDAQPGRFKI